MRKLVLGVVLYCLVFNVNSAVILDSIRVEYSDIYSSYVDIEFDTTIYQDGNYILSNPSALFTNIQYGGLIKSLSSLQVTVDVTGDTAALLATSWTGLDSSVSHIRGDLNTIKNYNGWNIGNGSYNFSYSVAPPVPEVPIPSAVWLFGSGLIGLIGLARRKGNA